MTESSGAGPLAYGTVQVLHSAKIKGELSVPPNLS